MENNTTTYSILSNINDQEVYTFQTSATGGLATTEGYDRLAEYLNVDRIHASVELRERYRVETV